MAHATDELAAVASEAVTASGAYLRSAFRNGSVDAEFTSTDVKMAADRESERRIRRVIAERFPTHAFHGEEVGRVVADPDVDAADGTSHNDYRWVVDPLDGTNNLASGYPLCATAVAVLHAGEPVVAAIYEPLIDDLYLAEHGAGATLNSEGLSATGGKSPSTPADASPSTPADASPSTPADASLSTRDSASLSTTDGQSSSSTHSLPLEHGTVALVVGLSAVETPPLAAAANDLRGALEAECKRVVESWAPCVDWGLLARGSIEGLVCFHPDEYEQHAGALLAAESGVTAIDTLDSDGRYVASPVPETAEALSRIVDRSLGE